MRNEGYTELGLWLARKWKNAANRLAEADLKLRPLLNDPTKNISEPILRTEIQAERDAETTPLRMQTQRRTQTTLDMMTALHARTKDLKEQIRHLKRGLEIAPDDVVDPDPDELHPPILLESVAELAAKEDDLKHVEAQLQRRRQSLGVEFARVESVVNSEWTHLRIKLLAKKQILRAKLRERKNHYRQADRTSHLASNPANHHNHQSSRSRMYLLCCSGMHY